MRTTILLLFCFIATLTSAQKTDDQAAIEAEVNQQLWKPFVSSYKARDWKVFNDLHTNDVMRVSKWGIRQGDTYKESIKERYEKKDGITRTIELWFEHRIYSGDTGYEVGYYKVTNTKEDGTSKSYYARFHVMLKKVDGKWKIAQDWDTDSVNGVAVTEGDFGKGDPVKF